MEHLVVRRPSIGCIAWLGDSCSILIDIAHGNTLHLVAAVDNLALGQLGNQLAAVISKPFALQIYGLAEPMVLNPPVTVRDSWLGSVRLGLAHPPCAVSKVNVIMPWRPPCANHRASKFAIALLNRITGGHKSECKSDGDRTHIT